MIHNNKLSAILVTLSLAVILTGCKKDWLDAKPEKALVVPSKVKDLQALLDNTSYFNKQGGGMAEISAGDFYILFSSYQSLFGALERSAYTWAPTSEFYQGSPSADWEGAYIRILNTNVVLYGTETIKYPASEQEAMNTVKGGALFFRAFDFYYLAQTYCKAYVPATAKTDLGIPLRLDYDVNIPTVRATVQETYDQIIGDLKKSVTLLNTTPAFKTRPSKQAAYAMLARTCLSMADYEQAGLYADSALKIQNGLLLYSTLNTGSTAPFARFNTEVIFQSVFSYGIFNVSRLIVDPVLLSMYDTKDLRRSAFFTIKPDNTATYKGSYNADKNFFGGLATDEMLLIRAECFARKGQATPALKDLNDLLRTRWSGTYTDIVTNDPSVALSVILTERRKELVYRGLRWTDLRRLNREDKFKVTLTRTLNGITYTLPPNDPRYVFPIDEIELRLSGIQQNLR